MAIGGPLPDLLWSAREARGSCPGKRAMEVERRSREHDIVVHPVVSVSLGPSGRSGTPSYCCGGRWVNTIPNQFLAMGTVVFSRPNVPIRAVIRSLWRRGPFPAVLPDGRPEACSNTLMTGRQRLGGAVLTRGSGAGVRTSWPMYSSGWSPSEGDDGQMSCRPR